MARHLTIILAALTIGFPPCGMNTTLARGGAESGRGEASRPGPVATRPAPVGARPAGPGYREIHRSGSVPAPHWGYPVYAGWGYPYYGYGVGIGIGYPYPVYGTTTYVYGSNTYANPSAYSSTATVSQIKTADFSTSVKSYEFARKGDDAFKSSRYDDATYLYRHAIVDEPQNGILVLKLAQSLFARSQFDEAAGAVQAAMSQLPSREWGTVVHQHEALYGRNEDYTDQLHVLERAVRGDPRKGATRFLLAYHYAYLGFHRQSLDQLRKIIQLEPRDTAAKELRDEVQRMVTVGHDSNSIPPSPVPPVPAEMK